MKQCPLSIVLHIRNPFSNLQILLLHGRFYQSQFANLACGRSFRCGVLNGFFAVGSLDSLYSCNLKSRSLLALVLECAELEGGGMSLTYLFPMMQALHVVF